MIQLGNRLLTRRRALLAGGAAVVGGAALGLRACDRAEAPVDEQGRVRLRFATDWRAQAEQGGFYQALATGAYEKRGLNVQIVQGGPGVNVPQLLASGAVELGMGSNSFIPMNLVAAGAPVKAVAAFFQKDPQVLIAHPDPALETIADLKGRPFLLADASINAFWVWLKAKYGFTDEQVRKYTFNLAPFLADERAVQQGYLTSEPYTIEQEAGFEPKRLPAGRRGLSLLRRHGPGAQRLRAGQCGGPAQLHRRLGGRVARLSAGRRRRRATP
jgi:NitT/TauT family transport system substrate-binding protein